MRSKLWSKAPSGELTTGIGSLPHAHLDAALEFSFRAGIPFLPQLPIRNQREYMLVQAIEGLPGLIPEEGGAAQLDAEKWRAGRDALRAKTDKAFACAKENPEAFAEFEPSPEMWSCWNPFLWELGERDVKFAKIQLTGPLTCQWSLQTTDGSPVERDAEMSIQVYRLILARAVAMVRKLKLRGVTPLFFIDEPAFFVFSAQNHKHGMALQELRIFVQTLQKEEALVGLHCCSNTDWKSVLSLPLDILSIDTHLSLNSLLSEKPSVQAFLAQGGRFALGAVPTGGHSLKIHGFTPQLLADVLVSTLIGTLGEATGKSILQEAVYTPACGLALHTVEDAELIFENTLQMPEQCRAALSRAQL